MNIFVLNTGRCGSKTFIEASKHITNYSCAHESRSGMLHHERLKYPENHIEADNRLSWFLGRLDEKYGDHAFYVHLKRNDADTARSFSKRYSHGIINAYRKTILMNIFKDSDPMSICLDYCDTVNSNIEHFLKNKSKKLTIALENIDQGFKEFWNLIGAAGDIDAALSELKNNYNATRQINSKEPSKPLVSKIFRKFNRLVVKLPQYVKSA